MLYISLLILDNISLLVQVTRLKKLFVTDVRRTLKSMQSIIPSTVDIFRSKCEKISESQAKHVLDCFVHKPKD